MLEKREGIVNCEGWVEFFNLADQRNSFPDSRGLPSEILIV